MSSIIRWLKYGLFLTMLVLIAMLLFGQLVGQPMVIFVDTGSMEPTLEPGDGYVAIPSMFASEVQEDDVILFEAEELDNGGGMTTHRVDDVTDEGYITKGDANPFTDQEDDEPPVQEGQIQSVGLRVGGELVVIPELGTATQTISGVTNTVQERLFPAVGLEPPGNTAFTTGMLGLSLLLLLVTAFGEPATGHRSRRSRGKPSRKGAILLLVLLLIIIVPLNFTMLLPSGVYEYEIVSSTNPDENNEQTIEAGTSTEITYSIQNSGQIPIFVIMESASEGAHIPQQEQYVSRQSTENVSVTMDAPRETGTHYRYIEERRYVVLLPPSLIAALNGVHPALAMLGINLPVALVVIIVGTVTLGTGRLRLRSRSRGLSIREQVRRKVPGILCTRSEKTVPKPPWKHDQSASPRNLVEPPTPPHQPVDPTLPPSLAQSSIRRYSWLNGVIETSPDKIGLDGDTWTPTLLRAFLEHSSDRYYTQIECQRVMDDLTESSIRMNHVSRDQSVTRERQRDSTDDRYEDGH